ncbi:MAG TPA: polysaccharide biosynthesis tyrosine autokinase [Mucilaginibacter sp.]|nr:polysaccharide biosynthesis tyrosine autokinase [Mucilaginibacter sp.]
MAVTTNDNRYTTITLPVSQNPTTDFAKVFKKYVFHWPIFLLSLIIFIGGAFFYLKYAKAIYPINATIAFKDSKNQDQRQDKDNINQLDQISAPVIFENEIEIIKSKKIMMQVVNSMNLWVGYAKKEGVISTDLYKNSPVKFQFIKMPDKIDDKGIKLSITIDNAQGFTVEDKSGKQSQFKYGQYIQSDFGLWKLDVTPYLNAFMGSKIAITIGDPSGVADYYVNGLKSTLDDKEVPFVDLSMSDVVPQRGVDILNAVINAYMKAAVDEKNKKTDANIKFINKRIDSIAKDLHMSEAQIESYASSKGLTSNIDAQSQTYVQDAQQSQKALDDINLQIRIINSIENYVNSPGSNKQPSTVGLQDASLTSLLDKLTEAELRKQNLLANNPPDNPVFEPVNNEISALQANIREKIRNDKETLLLTRGQAQSTNSRAEGQLRSIPGQQTQLNGMHRDNDAEAKLYSFLLEQREALSLKYASTVTDAKVVDYAHAGDSKWPKSSIVYVLALFAGMIFPIGIIYTRNSFDDKITHRRQIEQEVDIPILGELSFQESSTAIVITKERGSFAIGEQFRALRSKLYQVLSNNEGGKVCVVTSSTSGEGKSFVSANMSVTLAYAARKTIILEMDLRKPKIASIFELPDEHLGISDYLESDHLSIDSLIRPSGIPGLDVMSAGTIQENPSELLEKVNLDNLIDILRKKYDFVIIDSPPIHLVTDALIISRVTDACLYVIRQGYTLKEELDFINEVKNENRFPKLNLIFNGIKREKYGYGYNYNNSYYNTYTSRPKNTFGRAMKGFLARF